MCKKNDETSNISNRFQQPCLRTIHSLHGLQRKNRKIGFYMHLENTRKGRGQEMKRKSPLDRFPSCREVWTCRKFKDALIQVKDLRKFFSQEWDRRGGPTSIKKILMGAFIER